VIEDEIRRLKKKSRYMNPDGDPELEHQIAGMEKMLTKGKRGRAELRKARTRLNKGYAHRREDIPDEAKKMLGQIDEAAFAGAKGAFTQKADLIKDRLFKSVLERPDWAIPTRFKNPRTGEVTVKKLADPPDNFVQVQSQSGEDYGALEGAWVRRDIWDDLREVQEWRGAFIQNWDKALGWWKYGKVVLNPATHARNTMSNMILAYLGGLNPADAKTYGKAAKAVMQGEKNAAYKEAADWGLFNDTFVSAEITKLRDELEGLRDSAPKKFIKRAFQAPAEIYQGNEKVFKMALFMKQRAEGKSVDEAARHAEKFLFNYGDIPPWVKHTKRWLAPFMTFTYKAVPLFAEMAIRKPWKVAAIAGAMYGLEEYAKHNLGMSDEEAAPSPNSRLARLGILKAMTQLSIRPEAPRK